MNGYKEDQGRLARMFAFWTLTLLCLFGSHFLFEQLVRIASMRSAIGGLTIPIVAVELSPAFLVAAIVFLIGFVLIYRWQQRPKMADLLIDTEAELRKVTWPTLEEVINTSLVVVVFVVFLGLFIGFADIVLTRVVRVLIF